MRAGLKMRFRRAIFRQREVRDGEQSVSRDKMSVYASELQRSTFYGAANTPVWRTYTSTSIPVGGAMGCMDSIGTLLSILHGCLSAVFLTNVHQDKGGDFR
jgi:hypothetical protein